MNTLLTYRRLTEADVPTFVAMRIAQLKEEGAKSDLDIEPALTAGGGWGKHHRHQRHVVCGKAAVLQQSHRKNRIAVQYVHESHLSQTRHCSKTAGSCGGRSQNLWLRSRVDHCV